MKTLRDIVTEEHPSHVDDKWAGGVLNCPSHYINLRKYLEPDEYKRDTCPRFVKEIEPGQKCEACWNRVVEE